MSSNWCSQSLTLGGLVTLVAAPAWADRNQDIEQYLREFQQSSARVMMQRPVKKNGSGQVVQQVESAFSQQDIRSKAFVEQRDKVRQGVCAEQGGARVCMRDVTPGRAPIGMNDRPEEIVDSPDRLVNTLEQMESRRLKASRLDESPWSDDYWAIYKGILGARYADTSFPEDSDWQVNKSYVTESGRTPLDILGAGNASSIDDLSPSEKYDLLVGDRAGTLTAKMWEEGEQYYRENGKVETWMGVCHGWAPGAFMLPRPKKAIEVTAADGRTTLKFYPSDVKALGTLLWAKADSPSKFVGGRCNDKSPKTDSNGRTRSAGCFDNNPGTWHMTVVNQIGVSRRSFVLDATYDYEVWNQPVYGYDYRYFNPKTGKPVEKLQNAKILLSDYTNDKFRSYRSRDAKYVVGVSMDASYVVETQPSHATTDDPSRDSIRTVTYNYDLELNSAGEIIGGEWYTNLHPDFLWVPPVGTRAVSVGDGLLSGRWDGRSSVPSQWRSVAARTSRAGQPLAAIVEALVTRSRVER